MECNAILIGSYAYGTPRPDSDIDIAVLASDSLLDLLTEHSDGEGPAVRFGKLNLICCTEEDQFEVWRDGTAELVEKSQYGPVSRERAVRHFKKLLGELNGVSS